MKWSKRPALKRARPPPNRPSHTSPVLGSTSMAVTTRQGRPSFSRQDRDLAGSSCRSGPGRPRCRSRRSRGRVGLDGEDVVVGQAVLGGELLPLGIDVGQAGVGVWAAAVAGGAGVAAGGTGRAATRASRGSSETAERGSECESGAWSDVLVRWVEVHSVFRYSIKSFNWSLVMSLVTPCSS